ncbi:hypothetical protein ERO13_A10G121150v2 [Gossypium hirsutum]|uniref:Uncharacterized protein n=1 Tax=Gossypium hirsutum TaxID=3635 RepID=A0ABM2YWY8_GOSHI|nr:uncharacterized protein LOC121208453 [Gossypium hirsutum]KAG4179706.1 hypothetical protein ERO13_A10G121150v2 [Gossypium hirsutum]
MSTQKLTVNLPTFLPATAKGGRSPRAFFTTARPLQCKKDEDASESVKEAADSVKNAAHSVSHNVKKMSDKVSETADVVKEKATEVMSLGAAKVATQIVKKKQEKEKEMKKNKKYDK